MSSWARSTQAVVGGSGIRRSKTLDVSRCHLASLNSRSACSLSSGGDIRGHLWHAEGIVGERNQAAFVEYCRRKDSALDVRESHDALPVDVR